MTPYLLLALALIATVGCADDRPVRWEHGWKTERVIATRYTNDLIGYNVSFSFPKNPNDCDRAELFEFLESHGWRTFEGGGYPGAPIFAVNSKVKNKADADRELPVFLPILDKWVRRNLR